MQNKILKNILQFNKCIFIKCNHVFQKHYSNEKSASKTGKDELLPMSTVQKNIMKLMGHDTYYDPIPKPRNYLLKYEPKFEDLEPRSMQDSFTSAIIPISKSTKLQRKYVSQNGSFIRNGRLLEDIDLFACWVCYKHLCIPNFDVTKIPVPYTFVTLLVDKTAFTNYIPIYNLDIRLSGHVSWVGKSSLEIILWIEQIDEKKIRHKITRSLFLMAARNAINTKAAPVNPIKPSNNYEQQLFDGGIERKNNRIKTFKQSTLNVEPNNTEQKIIHNLFMKTINKDTILMDSDNLPISYKWIHSTKILQTTPCYPEKLNVHNTIFGGYLMRIALETSFICAKKFCGKHPHLCYIGEIRFHKPIYVTSIIEMTSHVMYTKKNKLQILTTADVFEFDNKKDHQKSATSNLFQFTFELSDNKNSDTISHDIDKVIPRTYKEAMWYLEGRRKLLSVIDSPYEL